MDPRILEHLQSTDPEDRKKAVRALGRSLEGDAMRYLASIYFTDPNFEVQDLALQAGRHVKKSRAAQDWIANE